jgi:hypothetical protein
MCKGKFDESQARMSKWTFLDENYRPDVRRRRPNVRPRSRLPCGRSFTRGRVFTVRECGKNRVPVAARPCGHGSARMWGRVRAVMGGQSLGFPL